MSLLVDIQKNLKTFQLQVQFQAEEGVLGILGPSGCGKSMTLRCIAGVERPDNGYIALDGRVLYDSKRHIDLRPQQRQVGYLFQNYALFPNMTVQANILCGLRWEKDRKKRREDCQVYLERLQLSGLEGRYPSQLSGGQQQRVALARILASRPKLLLLDEPFSALDSYLRDKLLVELKRVLGDFAGISLAVTHSRDEAYKLCNQIALMESGRIYTQKPTKQLFADPGSLAGAIITGCKNFSRARRRGPCQVEALDWGICLTATGPVHENISHVGIRAHHFSSACLENRWPVTLLDRIEEPFEDTIRFRWRAQTADSQDLWWRLPKGQAPQNLPQSFTLGIPPEDVLLLYPGE